MSLEWLKVLKNTPDKPEILAIAQEHDIDPDAAFGKVFRVWSYFDEHTLDGHAPSVTKVLLDRLCGVTNFVNSMLKVGWLIEENGVLSVSNFDKHNGNSAKKRAQDALRKAKSRANTGGDDGHAQSVTDERQARDQEKEKEKDLKQHKPRAKKREKTEIGDLELDDKMRDAAEKYWQTKGAALDAQEQFFRFKSYHQREANRYVDWPAAWRTWYSSKITMDEGLKNAKGESGYQRSRGAQISVVDEQQAAIDHARAQLRQQQGDGGRLI
jgi:hypothetical protein